MRDTNEKRGTSVIGARKGHTETQIHDLHEYTVRVDGCDVVLVMQLEGESWAARLAPSAARAIADMLRRATYDGGMQVLDDAVVTRARAELDRLRHDVQTLRDRMRRLGPGDFVLASDVAEALGDMLDGDDAVS
jgi:hypothetical protein